MPLENAMRGEVTSSQTQSRALDRWHTSLTSRSGEELEFSESYPVLLEKWANASTGMPTKVPTSALNEFIAFELSLVPEVEFVFTAFRNSVFYVWVITEGFEEDVRRRIYDREKAIIDEFHTFEFDFYIVPMQGQSVWDLVSEEITLAFQRGA